jgi:hypothetical protein
MKNRVGWRNLLGRAERESISTISFIRGGISDILIMLNKWFGLIKFDGQLLRNFGSSSEIYFKI